MAELPETEVPIAAPSLPVSLPSPTAVTEDSFDATTPLPSPSLPNQAPFPQEGPSMVLKRKISKEDFRVTVIQPVLNVLFDYAQGGCRIKNDMEIIIKIETFSPWAVEILCTPHLSAEVERLYNPLSLRIKETEYKEIIDAGAFMEATFAFRKRKDIVVSQKVLNAFFTKPSPLSFNVKIQCRLLLTENEEHNIEENPSSPFKIEEFDENIGAQEIEYGICGGDEKEESANSSD